MPYELIAIMQHGREIIVAQGYNPTAVRDDERKICHDPRAVKRIELRDASGCLEALWDADWR